MTKDQKIHLYCEMIRIRWLEYRCILEYQTQDSNIYPMGGFLVSTIGQEALPVVIRSIMGEDDHTITGPRGLGAALACGLLMESIIAELFGLSNGCNSGKGGMFSFFAPQYNHWGCHATVAAQTPLALGFAFANKYKNQSGVSFCTLGDGAVNQGVFHETLNLAGPYELPIVFIIENNGYGMGTSVRRASAFKDHLAQRAEAYDIEWDLADGWQLEDLREKLTIARGRAVSKSRPTVLEVSTYRYNGFTIADANTQKYRTLEEIEFHKEHRDPITAWQDQLISEGILDADAVESIRADSSAESRSAARDAKKGGPALEADITKHVYWEVDHNSPASKHGQYFF